jgi:hypothetical protein
MQVVKFNANFYYMGYQIDSYWRVMMWVLQLEKIVETVIVLD